MNNHNFVNLLGRLTSAPELKQTSNGRSYVATSIAVQRNYKNKDGNYDTDFVNVSFLGKTAEFVAQHFGKGDVISCTGSITVTTKATEAGNRTYTSVLCDSVAFVPGTKSSGGNGGTASAPATQQAPAATAPTTPTAGSSFVPSEGAFPGFGGDDDMPLPF